MMKFMPGFFLFKSARSQANERLTVGSVPQRVRPESASEVEATSIPALLEREDCMLVAWYSSLTHLAREGRMTVTIGRRELLAALGGAAATARAQPNGLLNCPIYGGARANAQATARLSRLPRFGMSRSAFAPSTIAAASVPSARTALT